MIPQDGSSNNVLRWPEDFFFQVFFFFFQVCGLQGAHTLFLFFKGDCVSHSPPAPLILRHQIQHSSTCSTFSAQMAETGLGPSDAVTEFQCGKINLSFEVKQISV